MNSAQSKKEIQKLPDSSGVYFFNRKNQVLYIGKATSLKSRVKSYFTNDLSERRGLRIVKMMDEADKIGFEKTDSALEAIILESILIKKHKPKYNAIGSDDKSFMYVVITDEDFPRIALLRTNDFIQSEIGTYKLPYKIKNKFGPYPSGGSLKEALNIIRKIFPFRDEKAKDKHNERFYQSLGLSPKIEKKDAKKEYAKIIRHISLFFGGKKKTLVKDLEKEMKILAKAQKFEQAEKVKRTIFALNHIRDVSLIKKDFYTENVASKTGFRIEAYDIAHTSGKEVVGVMAVLVDGEPDKSQYRKFNIKGGKGNNDVASLKEVLERRLEHSEWQLPRLIVIDGGKAQLNTAEKVLREAGIEIPVVSVLKDEFHRPKKILKNKKIEKLAEDDIIFANAEAHRFAIAFHRKKREFKIRRLQK